MKLNYSTTFVTKLYFSKKNPAFTSSPCHCFSQFKDICDVMSTAQIFPDVVALHSYGAVSNVLIEQTINRIIHKIHKIIAITLPQPGSLVSRLVILTPVCWLTDTRPCTKSLL